MKSKSDLVVDWHRRTKKRLVDAFGGKCGICGYNKSLRSLQFHHIKPEEKVFNISGRFKSWNKLFTEAKKCCLLCANCHMEVHEGLTIIPHNIRLIDDTYKEYKKDFTLITDNCPICGKEKPIKRKTCSPNCNHINQQKVERPSKEELIKMINEMTWVQIGRIYKVSDNAVRKWAKKYKIL